MPRPRALIACLLLLACGVPVPALQLVPPAEQPARFCRTPALSPDGTRISFSWQGNLWVAPVEGGAATRLTATDANDLNPRWSPDGAWLAFNSDREGGNQIFLIPSTGGPVRQITFHSVATTVFDWFPDGKELLVGSSRDTRSPALYRMELPGGRLKLLVEDDTPSLMAALSPDGKWLAYTRGAIVDLIRKGYEGAANFDIWVMPTDRSEPPRRLTHSARNDMWPVWGADNRTVYYCSERAGMQTVWKQMRDGGKPEQVVTSPPDAVRYLAAARSGNRLVYECDNRACVTPAAGGPARAVEILCRTDQRGPRTTRTAFTGTGVQEFEISPDGRRVAFALRGDLYTVPIEKGADARRLTETPERERDLAWAPDGKSLAFVSNKEGNNRLYRLDIATRAVTPLTRSTGIDSDPVYSPDGKWIAFLRAPQTGIHVIRPDGSGEQAAVPGPKARVVSWSPDGKWLAFERENDIRTVDVFVVPVEAQGEALAFGTAINVTDHPGYNEDPAWFKDGSRVAFVSNRYRNRDIETINDSGRYALYTVSLQKEKETLPDEDDGVSPPPTPPVPAATPAVKVDPDEIERRAKRIVGLDEGVSSFAVSPDSKTVVFVTRTMGQSDLWQTSADGGANQRLTTTGESPTTLRWAPDSGRVYYLGGGQIKWVSKGGGGTGTVAFTVRLEVDRLEDYRAVFDEAWQVMNDTYYDRTHHGVDWKAVGTRYRALVEHVSGRRDFNYLITQMLGELNSSHTGFFGGVTPTPTPAGPPSAARESGYLGIRVDEAHAGPGVRIREVLKRSPADREESRLKPGEVIVEVDGKAVQPDAQFDRALLEKVGRVVTLTVNDRPTAEGARKVRIKPIGRAAWNNLLYERWLDERRELVDRFSGRRIGYLHVDDMGDAARNRFERELLSVGMRREGMVLDFRGNGGGDTHDSLLRILSRNRHYFNFAPRTETAFPQPEKAYTRPVILLIDEAALSDAEVFANGFRELKLGKIVGQPTMGWIIFTSGRALVDGSFIRTPHLGCFTLSGKDMENWGVPPDIRVERSPEDFLLGRDPQLQRAVEELLKEPGLKQK